ncbi:hypothetical protein [Microlunatus speluncae]|uniref:hypothetical protein n=1 Tax=Microlunatus speluncae TaxID=2594267 RepID=UPI0012661968|nr:hypothetical protein [Microlunatus speluncae]
MITKPSDQLRERNQQHQSAELVRSLSLSKGRPHGSGVRAPEPGATVFGPRDCGNGLAYLEQSRRAVCGL